MAGNREIRRQFSLFAELLLLHGEDERLATLLSRAAYRTRRITGTITKLPKEELSKLFRPEIVRLIEEIKKKQVRWPYWMNSYSLHPAVCLK